MAPPSLFKYSSIRVDDNDYEGMSANFIEEDKGERVFVSNILG
jgi:hypothetical protein